MNTLEVRKQTNTTPARTMNSIVADASNKLPSRIQLIKAGTWIDSVKGNLTITEIDLHEYVGNFDRGLGLPGGGEVGLPIDFMHEDWSKAAGWIKKLTVEGDILYADVEWTRSGREALEGGDFKCVSPSFYPSCLGYWYDPEDPTITARNVLVGAGLTNIPFFKGLTPIMASQTPQGDGRKNVIFVSASTEGEIMDLAQILSKNPADVTAEEKAFLVEHKSELRADQLVAFGIESTQEETAEEKEAREKKEAEEAEAKKAEEEAEAERKRQEEEAAKNAAPADAVAVAASIKAGTHVLVEASAFKNLEAQVKASADIIKGYETERVTASVAKHVARGAIKADQADKWTQRILADQSVEDLLKDLPDNKLLASEIGKEGNGTGNATAQIEAKVQEAIKASNGSLPYGDAVSQVRRANPELAKQYDEEIKGN